jgi:hypothetical protein
VEVLLILALEVLELPARVSLVVLITGLTLELAVAVEVLHKLVDLAALDLLEAAETA